MVLFMTSCMGVLQLPFNVTIGTLSYPCPVLSLPPKLPSCEDRPALQERAKLGKPWNQRTDDELWIKVLGEVAAIGRAEPGETLETNPKSDENYRLGG